ncbi:MAG TPA: SpoIIE family protein phosphatase [Streptosporangiaceae bacterium]|nr:SpoIIE family protein phosphatase [Streptosporangiaceae bacterium]
MNADANAATQTVSASVPAAGGPAKSREMIGTEVILHQVETAVIVVDHDGCLRYANDFAAGLFGFDDPEQLTDVPFRALGFDEDDLSKVANLERQSCRGKDWEGTLSIKRKDGANFFIRMNATPMRGPAGEVAGTVIMAKEALQVGTESATDRVGLLDRIGQRLNKSLELDDTLREVADALVPQFADHCFIDLRMSDGRKSDILIRRVQMSAWSWEPPAKTWASIGEPVNYPKGHFCKKAIEQDEVVLVEDVNDQAYPAPTTESMSASRDVGITSVIAAPLTARGQRLGVMSLALSGLTVRDAKHYVADDRDLVAAIASRVAIAIDNAMLFEEERKTALAFQDSLLPATPPMLDGLEVAYRYVPAKPLESHGQGIQTQVGGDWYDIIQLSAGRIGIVIGDVQGRGARAAAFMGQLRSALRAFAQDDKAPSEILRRLDHWCQTMAAEGSEQEADSPTASCTYLIYDPWSRMLTIANAGHMSPLMVTKGDVRPLELKFQGVLLGVRSSGIPGLPTYREETRELPPGATLIFYTDGLVDRRARADGPGHYGDSEVMAMLSEAVKAVADEEVDRVAEAAEHAVPGNIDDDMAILVVRTAPDELETWDKRFKAEPIKVSEARKIAFDMFMQCGMDDDQADLACLLVSEVVTNVVLHTAVAPAPRHEFAQSGRSGSSSGLDDWVDSPLTGDFVSAEGQEFILRIRKGAESVWVEVFDYDLRLPRIRMAGENDEGGRGLYLVDQLAERWGSRPTDEGKAVWFQMPIRAASASLLGTRTR